MGVSYRSVHAHLLVAVFILAAQRTPAPYVSVYHDDAVTFQVRRDRVREKEPGLYQVWLRWLWRTPQPLKSDFETMRVAIADVDCKQRRVREYGVIHKNKDSQVIASEDTLDSDWRSFDRDSGAAATIGRLCQFLPQLKAYRR